MKFHEIDLRIYRLQSAEKSRCGKCKATLFLLAPRPFGPERPMYYMCSECGKITQAGEGEIAPAEGDVPEKCENCFNLKFEAGGGPYDEGCGIGYADSNICMGMNNGEFACAVDPDKKPPKDCPLRTMKSMVK